MSYWDQELEEGGGGVTGFVGRITDAYFDQGDYSTSLKLVAMPNDPENYPSMTDGTYTMFFGCGRDWVTRDSGETVVHQSGEPKAYRKDSKMGRLFEHLKTVPGLREAYPDFNPYQAKSFRNLELEFGRIEIATRKPKRDGDGNMLNKTGDIVKEAKDAEWFDATESLMVPIALVGQPTASTNGAGVDVNSLGIESATVTALAITAQTPIDDKTFMEELVKLGLTGNKDLMVAVSRDLPGLRKAFADAVL